MRQRHRIRLVQRDVPSVRGVRSRARDRRIEVDAALRRSLEVARCHIASAALRDRAVRRNQRRDSAFRPGFHARHFDACVRRRQRRVPGCFDVRRRNLAARCHFDVACSRQHFRQRYRVLVLECNARTLRRHCVREVVRISSDGNRLAFCGEVRSRSLHLACQVDAAGSRVRNRQRGTGLADRACAGNALFTADSGAGIAGNRSANRYRAVRGNHRSVGLRIHRTLYIHIIAGRKSNILISRPDRTGIRNSDVVLRGHFRKGTRCNRTSDGNIAVRAFDQCGSSRIDLTIGRHIPG